MSFVSDRIQRASAAFAGVKAFYFTSRYGEKRNDPGICDFTFGNPHGGFAQRIHHRHREVLEEGLDTLSEGHCATRRAQDTRRSPLRRACPSG